jgi:uncharacterized membrane protein YphA (DoxX/SURF4 family)
MADRRRYLGSFAIMALVMLRLVIGWHFFREGTQKLQYDRRNGTFRLAFTSEGFLNQAKGPLAFLYRAQAPDVHGWQEHLAARENLPPSEEQAAEQVRWQAADDRRRAEAVKKGEVATVEFSPFTPYYSWAERISQDWRATLDKFKAIPALNDEQRSKAEAALQARLQQLKDYLASEAEAIGEYRHELWRLEKWRKAPEAGAVPFHDQRIATKAAETSGRVAAWINQVKAFDTDFLNDLRSLLTTEQRQLALTTTAVEEALSDPRQNSLRVVDISVTVLTIGVGICLLLGMFTRLAALAGALFLLAVIGSQPPWLPDAAPTMPNVIEFFSLLVLAGTGAGRWAGLDFLTYALFHRKNG